MKNLKLGATLFALLLFSNLPAAKAQDDFPVTNIDSPARYAVAITPNDGTTLDPVLRAIWVGTAGTLCVDLAGPSTNVCFANASGWMPLRATKVYATGTTASGIVGVR